MLLFRCDLAERGEVIELLVGVVQGQTTATDEERMRQLLISTNISHGVILDTEEEE